MIHQRVAVDFNELLDLKDILLLAQNDVRYTAAGSAIAMRAGERLGVYEPDVADDGTPDPLLADGLIMPNPCCPSLDHGPMAWPPLAPTWGTVARWCLLIDPRGIRHASDTATRVGTYCSWTAARLVGCGVAADSTLWCQFAASYDLYPPGATWRLRWTGVPDAPTRCAQIQDLLLATAMTADRGWRAWTVAWAASVVSWADALVLEVGHADQPGVTIPCQQVDLDGWLHTLLPSAQSLPLLI
jgi:hypothetical protein